MGPYVLGLKSFAVTSFDEVEQLIRKGAESRHTASTEMNADSSRSHAIFTVTVSGGLPEGFLYCYSVYCA